MRVMAAGRRTEPAPEISQFVALTQPRKRQLSLSMSLTMTGSVNATIFTPSSAQILTTAFDILADFSIAIAAALAQPGGDCGYETAAVYGWVASLPRH